MANESKEGSINCNELNYAKAQLKSSLNIIKKYGTQKDVKEFISQLSKAKTFIRNKKYLIIQNKTIENEKKK
jgi:hypothetical protein